jgi:hypothetical protein
MQFQFDVREQVYPRMDQGLARLEEAISAAAGALLSTVALYPLELARTKIVTQTSRSAHTVDTLRQLLEEGGPLALYRGVLSKSAHSVVQGFSYFYCYAYAKQLLESRSGKSLGTLANLGAGYAAAVVNVGLTLPLEVRSSSCVSPCSSLFKHCRAVWSWRGCAARSCARYRASHVNASLCYAQVVSTRAQMSKTSVPFWKAAMTIYQDDGPTGFFRGFMASVLLCINPAINYTTFEQLRRRWVAMHGTTHLTTMQAFVLGAFAKAVSTLLTYPWMRAKILLQSGVMREASDVHPVSTVPRAPRVCPSLCMCGGVCVRGGSALWSARWRLSRACRCVAAHDAGGYAPRHEEGKPVGPVQRTLTAAVSNSAGVGAAAGY